MGGCPFQGNVILENLALTLKFRIIIFICLLDMKVSNMILNSIKRKNNVQKLKNILIKCMEKILSNKIYKMLIVG